MSCGDTYIYIDPARNAEILSWLKDTPGQVYNYLVDITAVEYRDAELPIEVVYELFSARSRLGSRHGCPRARVSK